MEALPDIVASIEAYEKKTERILSTLVRRYPRSVKVLRAQGMYYEDIKNDVELAQQSYRLADEIEEEKAKKHTRSS